MNNLPTTERLLTRQARLAMLLNQEGLEALALNPGPTLTYLTGLNFHLSERPVVLLFVPHNPPVLVLPELEAGKIDLLPFPVQAFPYNEDPDTWPGVFRQAMLAAVLKRRKVGVESGRMRFLELSLLQAAGGETLFEAADTILARLRMQKDAYEIEQMRAAVKIAQKALLATFGVIKPGMSEREIAAELTMQIYRNGSDAELPFNPIVSAGPNGANPHATPTNRLLVPGDLLVIDWGASTNGYFSDLTRTFAIGDVDPELTHIVEVVCEANAVAREIAAPGVSAGNVDQAARQVIEKAGYGEFFIHRTGHGLGMETHEPPYIRSGNALILEPGMTFTIEPGIYLPGKNGVRIEDDMVITDRGAESLSDLPRQLQQIG
jgi:Xaa-Pro dipeptidase